MGTDTDAPRRLSVRIIAIVMFAGGLNALLQVPQFLPRFGSDPALLSLQQAWCGVVGLWAAVAGWKHRANAWIPTLAYGVLTAVLIISLGRLLELDAAAAKALWVPAVVILVVVGGAAAFLRVALAPRPADTPARPAA